MGESLKLAARGASMSAAATCSRTFTGRPDQMAQVRRFLAGVLQDCPALSDVTLMAGELAANAVQHSHSGEPGSQFSVHVAVCDGRSVWVGVEDEGGPTAPRLHAGAAAGGEERERGRGLRIVAGLATAWGVTGDVIGRTVWFRVGWGTP